MPKKLLKIDDFSGGTNGYADPQNIEDNELAQCSGFKSEKGELVVLGDMLGAYTLGAGPDVSARTSIDIESGYGLFTFSHDYDMAANNAAVLNSANYFIMQNEGKFDIYDDKLHTWQADEIDLGTAASDNDFTDFKPCFFFVDGTLRISPGNFDKVVSGGTLNNVTQSLAFRYGDTVIAGGTWDDKSSEGDCIEVNGLEYIKVDNDTIIRNATGTFEGLTAGGEGAFLRLETRWRGVIKKAYFQGITTVGTFFKWYSSYMHPRPPINETTVPSAIDSGEIPFKSLISIADHAVNNYTPFVDIGVYAVTANTDATWPTSSSYKLYITALYDDSKQESQPHLQDSDFAFTVGYQVALWVGVVYGNDASNYHLNLRCTGARVYYEDPEEVGVLYQMLEIDFEKGCKKAGSERFSPWVNWTTNKAVACPAAAGFNDTDRTGANVFIFEVPPRVHTYETNNGYPADTNTHARFKTAVVANRRTYIGNVYQGGRAYGDRMIKSPVNKFDTFPETNFIDVAVGDGDEIVKLEVFADRLLQFKKRTLYIINIGGDYEFLESQHANMGVENPSQTCITEFGIAWVNRFGVYIYDGKGITELSRGKLKAVDTTDRARALNIIESNIPLIGYHSLNKWIVIHLVSDTGTAFDAQAWIYDFKNGSWTWSQEFTADADYKTNLINTHDNELVFAAGTNSSNTPDFFKFREVTADPAEDKLFLLTKDFTLDLPSVKKNVYSVYITYLANGTSQIEADIIYKTSTGETIIELIEANAGTTYYTKALGFKTTSNEKATVELVPESAIKNANSFQLKLHNRDAAHDSSNIFKLYSISFRYRDKGVH